jgi:hypothetical protein
MVEVLAVQVNWAAARYLVWLLQVQVDWVAAGLLMVLSLLLCVFLWLFWRMWRD